MLIIIQKMFAGISYVVLPQLRWQKTFTHIFLNPIIINWILPLVYLWQGVSFRLELLSRNAIDILHNSTATAWRLQWYCHTRDVKHIRNLINRAIGHGAWWWSCFHSASSCIFNLEYIYKYRAKDEFRKVNIINTPSNSDSSSIPEARQWLKSCPFDFTTNSMVKCKQILSIIEK